MNAFPDFNGVVGVSTAKNLKFLGAKGIADRQLTPYTELYGVAYGFWVYELELDGKK